jgi:hypothetical protein
MLFDDPRELDTRDVLRWLTMYDNGLAREEENVYRLLDEGIQVPQSERLRLLTAIGRLSQPLKVRHWIAHGRYWGAPRGIELYTAMAVADIVGELYDALRKAAEYGGATPFT